MSREAFKTFVSKHPILVEKVSKEETTWQKLYEVYDIYKEDATAWEPYLKKEENKKVEIVEKNSDIFNKYLKNIDINQLQSGITSVQKVLGLVSDLFIKDDNTIDSKVNDSTYVSRAINNRFDD